MKIGASTCYGVINKPVIESVNELEKAGFDAIEISYEYNNILTAEEVKILKSRNLDFSMHCPYIGVMFTHLNSSFSAPQIKLIEKSLKAATDIGCSHYVIHGGLIPRFYTMIENKKSIDFFIRLFAQRFRKIFKKYSKNGLKIVVENLHGSNIGSRASDIIKIQELIPEAGFCFDIAHGVITDQINELMEKMNVDYVHIHDNNLSIDEHKVIGEGKINFEKILSKLKNKGFDGKLIIENTSYGDTKESLKNLSILLKTL
ncbi:MAG TPA: sugar phosphate isomerase/epimerase family protein [Candidatus Nanoarchaeia archaeon]|nr:sugar phosphate isomerase/epimerase family protein [Candidatus Nanoarchaeia archaeon]